MKISKDALSRPKILVYQDENCTILVDYLMYSGFDVITSSEEDIVQKIKGGAYDLCILSHYKSVTIGNLSLLKILKGTDKNIPAIIVSDLTKYQFIIEAYDEGADDYVERPYNPEILVRKVNAILRRSGVRTRTIRNAYNIGDYRLDVVNDKLTVGDTEIRLPPMETQFLALLCAYEGEVLEKGIVTQRLWSENPNYWNRRSLDVFLSHLRKHLKKDKRVSIITRPRLGYSLIINKDE